MFDGMKSPGRNDECWCGSGKKYKKCHLNLDERLQELYEQGEEVPHRSLLKTAADIEGIKKSAAINIGVLDYVAERIKAGVNTAEIDKWICDYTIEHGGTPADLNFEGYPNSVCTSINEVVCHGIPSDDDVLRDGDIVNIDCSTILDGYFSDSSRMFCIGEVSDKRRRLVEVTRESVQAGLAAVKPWGHLGDMSHAVQSCVEAAGFNVVRRFVGHGVGSRMHEKPEVPNFRPGMKGLTLQNGMVIAIEPMVTMGTYEVDILDDQWTAVTRDGQWAAHFEHSVAITPAGPRILSVSDKGLNRHTIV